jgi:hypothetical protein
VASQRIRGGRREPRCRKLSLQGNLALPPGSSGPGGERDLALDFGIHSTKHNAWMQHRKCPMALEKLASFQAMKILHDFRRALAEYWAFQAPAFSFLGLGCRIPWKGPCRVLVSALLGSSRSPAPPKGSGRRSAGPFKALAVMALNWAEGVMRAWVSEGFGCSSVGRICPVSAAICCRLTPCTKTVASHQGCTTPPGPPHRTRR